MFLVGIQVEALDRRRLLSDITKMLADQKVNILSASLALNKDRIAVSSSPSRWATQSIWTTCCVRSVASRASTTRIG